MAPKKKAFLDECLSEEEEQKEARLDCHFTLLKAKSVLSIGGLGPHGPFIGQVTLLPRREREREGLLDKQETEAASPRAQWSGGRDCGGREGGRVVTPSS